MSRQNKKERQRLKRKRKQQELRKKRNTSVFQILAQREGPVECYINSTWQTAGEANILALRPMPGGSNISVVFLVDFWCSGLKDAFGRLNVTRSEFQEKLEQTPDGLEIIPLDLITARRMIAGAMRLSVKNGFRLPHKSDRWASIIGVTGYADADLSDFETPNGKYRYIGSMQDLRKRLVGSVDQFLARDDIEFVLDAPALNRWVDEEYDEDDDFDDEESDEESDEEDFDEIIENEEPPARELGQAVAEVRERGLELIVDWLIGQGRKPSPCLHDAFMMTLLSMIADHATAQTGNGQQTSAAAELARDYPNPQGLKEAMAQIVEFMKRPESLPLMDAFVDSPVFSRLAELPAPLQAE